MIPSLEIAWLTGLLEGEGWFGTSARKIAIVVGMTDLDVVEHAARLLDGRIYGPEDRAKIKPHFKPFWKAQVNGPNAAAWMMTIYGALGQRRQGQVRRAIMQWRAMRYVRISPLVRRSILASWDAGVRNKVRLAEQFGTSRNTVYSVLDEADRSWRLHESPPGVSTFDIAWLAGLIEGEGSISINGRSLTLRVSMTDADVVARAATIMGTVAQRQRHYPPLLQRWLAQIKGEAAASWIMTIYPWLGMRRRQQASMSLTRWKQQGRGVVSRSLADTIVDYRRAGYAQTQIMRIVGVSKSSVYRHTVGRVPRCRITRQRMPAEAPAPIPS